MIRALAISSGILLAASSSVLAGHEMTGGAKAVAPGHLMYAGDDLTWTDGPPSLPPGAKMAVLEGAPAQAGEFTIRLQLPAGYTVPAHWHPANEHVTVISGSFSMGPGEKYDEKALKELPAGGYAVMTIGTRHFAHSKTGAVIQVHAMGPWAINYVNPDDDPRNRKPSK